MQGRGWISLQSSRLVKGLTDLPSDHCNGRFSFLHQMHVCVSRSISSHPQHIIHGILLCFRTGIFSLCSGYHETALASRLRPSVRSHGKRKKQLKKATEMSGSEWQGHLGFCLLQHRHGDMRPRSFTAPRDSWLQLPDLQSPGAGRRSCCLRG